jgi:hypothetical protein
VKDHVHRAYAGQTFEQRERVVVRCVVSAIQDAWERLMGWLSQREAVNRVELGADLHWICAYG